MLSHRGELWLLLQQTSTKLLNVTHTLIMKILSLNLTMDTTKYSVPFDLIKLRKIISLPFYMSADFLLDFMMNYQANHATVNLWLLVLMISIILTGIFTSNLIFSIVVENQTGCKK